MTDPGAALLTPGSLPGLFNSSMATTDGVRLDADIWMPPGDGPAPVLLMRQAYGRRLGSSLCYAHASWYAAQGFIVVIQDVRGTGSSEGAFVAFAHEGQDGYEAIEWAARLPRSNGRVGLFGFSYQGTNQLLAASLAPPSLKAMAPAMIGWDIGRDWASENGAFRLLSNIGWGIQMAAGTAMHERDAETWHALFAASRNPPVQAPVNGRPDVLARHAALSHHEDWVARAADDPAWAPLSPSARRDALQAAGIPALFIGGWFDTHLPGTLDAFDVLRSCSNTALLVGPWTHFPWDRHVGDRDFGPDAISPVDTIQLRWFRRWLMDDETVDLPTPISLFDMGTCAWRERATWPTAVRALFLRGTGLSSVRTDDGGLAPTASMDSAIDYLVHDPWRPAPSVGGAFGTPPGPVERSKVDNRSDVLTFTTPPLEAPLALFGAVSATLDIVCDAAAVDLACVLSRVEAGGAVTQIAEGYVSCLEAKPDMIVSVPLRATSATLAPGEQLRLSVAMAAFPAYPVNPGTGERPATAERFTARPITLGIRTGGSANSALHLTIDDLEDITAHA